MNFTNAKKLINICEENKITISQAMIRREVEYLGKDIDETKQNMSKALDIMKNAVNRAINDPQKSIGGLIGGEAKKLSDRRHQTKPVCGELISKAISYAMGTLEVNASMGLIVAAVTAGSSGVLPGVLLALAEEFNFSDDQLIDALFNAGAIGHIIAHNGSVSGAEGGCQAEVGSASAMAASAVVQLMGGTPRQCLDAAGTALTNLMGLVCDPIAGLVESPCQSRNAIGASNALISAEIALAGVKQVIPFDEIVLAMKLVGSSLAFELRETSLGGVAATPTACKIKEEIFG